MFALSTIKVIRHEGYRGDPEISVVVPSYNPGSRLRPTIEQLLDALQSTGRTFEVIVVSDGSTDDSDASISNLVGPLVKLHGFERNCGKGHALRTGMLMGRGKYIGFIDADGDIPPALMARFLSIIETEAPDAVLGSKTHPGSLIRAPVGRRALSFVWRLLVRTLLQLPVPDSQAGIKLFTRQLIHDAIPRTRMDGFAFDLELLVTAHDLGYRNFVNAPIDISERSGSTVSVHSALMMLGDFWLILWRTRLRRVLRRVRSIGLQKDDAPA